MLTNEVSVLGDVYALGLVGLQLLLGEPSIHRLQKRLQEAARGGGGRAPQAVLDNLDGSAGDWPAALTRDLVLLMLRCADPRRERRPDLAEEVQPLLRRAAERADSESQRQADGLELQLMCPLAKVRGHAASPPPGPPCRVPSPGLAGASCHNGALVPICLPLGCVARPAGSGAAGPGGQATVMLACTPRPAAASLLGLEASLCSVYSTVFSSVASIC